MVSVSLSGNVGLSVSLFDRSEKKFENFRHGGSAPSRLLLESLNGLDILKIYNRRCGFEEINIMQCTAWPICDRQQFIVVFDLENQSGPRIRSGMVSNYTKHKNVQIFCELEFKSKSSDFKHLRNAKCYHQGIT